MGKATYKTIKRVSLKMVREQNFRYSTEAVSNKDDVMSIVKTFLSNSAVERFIVIGLDTRNVPTVIHTSEGTVNQCAAYPATILKVLLLSNSISFIIAHNHPADTLKASNSDIEFTKKMRGAAKQIEIDLLDSVIFNSDGSEYVSLRELNKEIWYN